MWNVLPTCAGITVPQLVSFSSFYLINQTAPYLKLSDNLKKYLQQKTTTKKTLEERVNWTTTSQGDQICLNITAIVPLQTDCFNIFFSRSWHILQLHFFFFLTQDGQKSNAAYLFLCENRASPFCLHRVSQGPHKNAV